MILLLKFYPYHFVRTILSVPFCPIPFCPYTILSIPFCPYHFVRYHFVLEPSEALPWQCERPREKRIVLRERKEALGLSVNKVDYYYYIMILLCNKNLLNVLKFLILILILMMLNIYAVHIDKA